MSSKARESAARDRDLVRSVCRWFAANARDLPWRTGVPGSPRDPYRSLVSEVMLQQTQVSRVLEKFGPFMRRFPTAAALARADEQTVMAAWSGMGYYRRARSLHAAAKEIVARFQGRVPATPAAPRVLPRAGGGTPGVGRSPAGAVASLVFGLPEPIVDGNVARVLMRVEGKDVATALGMKWAWGRAEDLVRIAAGRRSPALGPGEFNEGLMELGATVCTPKGARCDACPLKSRCRALVDGTVDRIPRPRAQPARSRLFCASVVVEDAGGRLLVERRAERGMWGGLWQAPTLEGTRRASRAAVERWIGLSGLERVERFEHGTTHRLVEFDVWRGVGMAKRDAAAWKSRTRVAQLPLSNAQRRVLLGMAECGGVK